MIKKVAIILLCSSTTVLCMEKIEFMRNGASLSKTMTLQQKLEFMRNRGQPVQQLSEQVTKEEVKPVENEKPFVQVEPILIEQSLEEDDKSTEEELISHAIKLSLENQPELNKVIQKVNNTPQENITINYNITIKQKLKYSSQNINLGNKNKNY